MRPSIPLRNDDDIQAEADKNYRGDWEKVSTTALRGLMYRGVSLDSRYDKAHEYEVMVTIVQDLPFRLTKEIISVFCDSKAQSSYTIELENRIDSEINIIQEIVHNTLYEKYGGYNFLHLTNGRDERILGADWRIDGHDEE